VFDALYYAINNQTAPVISISYGLCEPFEVASGSLTQDENMLAQASAQGQTVVGPSGDNAATDCDSSTSAVHGLAVDFPASSPYVVAVGGTTFNENGGNYWSSVNNIYQGSALYYIPEIVWNDTSLGAGISGTGGGVSDQFLKPSWQVGVGVPNDGFRDVPDISFAASPGHDGYITCVQGDCEICVTTDANCPTPDSPGYRKKSDQTLDVVGGTSAGVPSFAGVLALVNQKMKSPQGNINQRLYQLAASAPYVFHDITVGDNKAPCTKGTQDCPNGGTIGYSAGVGYDQTTGLGSVNAYNLVSNWGSLAPADFGLSFFNPAITIARGNSADVLVTMRPQNGFGGTVNLTCSSNIVGVTCSVNPGNVSGDASATVTITVSPNATLHSPTIHPAFPWWTSAFGVTAFVGIGASRKKAQIKQSTALMCLLVVCAIGLVSCGTGTNFASSPGNDEHTAQPSSAPKSNSQLRNAVADQKIEPPAKANPTRPARGSRPAYAGITVKGTSGNLSHSTQILVTLN
jgi:subtilase family serine protease